MRPVAGNGRLGSHQRKLARADTVSEEDGEPALAAFTGIAFPWKDVAIRQCVRRTTQQHRQTEIECVTGGGRRIYATLLQEHVL